VPLRAHKEELFTLSMADRSAQMYGLAAYIPSPEPTEWFEDHQVIAIDDMEFTVIFGPGHCVGHVAFYNAAENLLIGGDILFRGSFGRTDLPGGSMEVLKKTIHERMFTLPENTVVGMVLQQRSAKKNERITFWNSNESLIKELSIIKRLPL
jgi:glyoxylase-like metal-dependent hydrolase (beta-lactamase superfamily II)